MHKFLVLLQVREIFYFKKGEDVLRWICCSDIVQDNVKLAGRKIIDIVHNQRSCAQRIWGIILRTLGGDLEEIIGGCGSILAFPFFLLERSGSLGMIHLD